MAATYTVQKGDTLSALAIRFGTTVSELVRLNNIADPDFIVIGQKLKLSGDPDTVKANKTSKPNIQVSGFQSNTDRTAYVTWTWDKDHTENYKTMWYYDTGDGKWFVGEDSTTEYKQSVYTAPTNARKLKFKVKAISKTHTVNGKETSYWTSDWSKEVVLTINYQQPERPSAPTVELDKFKLTASLSNIDTKADRIHFQVIKDNQLEEGNKVYKSGSANIKTQHGSYSCTVEAGHEYKVRCRTYGGTWPSEWSDYSESVQTIPAAPDGFTICRANSNKSIYLEWDPVNTADSYTIEYTTKKEYFDNAGDVSSQETEFTKYEIFFDNSNADGLGHEYFFRLRATNEQGESAWSPISSVVIGKPPAAPTTWSSTTTATVGEPLSLYWMHNAEDGSNQTNAELEFTVNGETITKKFAKGKHTVSVLIGKVTTTLTVEIATDDNDNDKTSTCVIDTRPFTEGTSIQWRVRTAGITATYGEQSIQRTVDIYAPPTMELHVTDINGNDIDTLEAFPFRISGLAGPKTQTPIGYHVVITANDAYETVDQVGNVKMVNSGDQVYSRYFDITDSLLIELSAGSVDLTNNVSYTVTCVVSMNSGLTAEESAEFTVSWMDLEYEPNAEISFDEDTLAVHICPYTEDDLDDVTLAVYRREFDGTFIEIASGIRNGSYTFVTDPHPALDYARYRIVATATATGAVSYYDMPGYPIGEKAAVIQWDEAWSSYETSETDEMEEPAWSGSMLKLPYNIDVSDSRKVDVALIEYIGRSHPISYYGTQLGETSSWSMDVPKSDKETLYALRRLSIWKGDVYVREPSGSGYWASISVSFSQNHCDVVIPVNLAITRVEGGI